MLSAGWDSSLSSNIPANFPIPCPVCGFKHRCTNYKQAIAIKLSSSKYLELNINRIICITHGNQKFHRCWKCWQDNERQTVFTVKYNTESLFPIIEVIYEFEDSSECNKRWSNQKRTKLHQSNTDRRTKTRTDNRLRHNRRRRSIRWTAKTRRNTYKPTLQCTSQRTLWQDRPTRTVQPQQDSVEDT